MSTQTHVMLVRDRRTRLHSVVRAVLPWEIDQPVPRATSEQLNGLMMAKTPLALTEAVEAAGPLYVRREDLGEGSEHRLHDAAELHALLEDGTFGTPEPQRLIDECVLDPFWYAGTDGLFHREGRNPIGDARKAAATRGPGAAIELFGPVDGNSPLMFEVEPLQDWVLLHNLLSVSLRLAGMARRATHEGAAEGIEPLELARFQRVGRTGLVSFFGLGAEPWYILPVVYNPWFREGGLLRNDVNYPSGLMHPLLDRLFEPRRNMPDVGAHRQLIGTGGDIRLLTAGSANVAEGPATPRTNVAEGNRLLYLALRGHDQQTMADALLRALNALLNTEDLSYAGYEIGAIPMDHRDAAGALWATFLRHEGRYLMTCRQCGRTVLSTTQGGAREFCSDTCRATYNKALRERPQTDKKDGGTKEVAS